MRTSLLVAGLAVAAALLGSGIAFAGDFTNPSPNTPNANPGTCSQPHGVTVVNCLDAKNLVTLHDIFGSDVLGPVTTTTTSTSSR